MTPLLAQGLRTDRSFERLYRRHAADVYRYALAELLGISVPAVETLIFRARRAVREQLEGSLTCAQAERSLSLEVDGRLSRADKGPLRAHLRECKPCAKIARSQRAQRSAFKAL